MLILPISAMEQQQLQDQQQEVQAKKSKRVYNPKDLKTQALVKLAQCSEITNEQIEQLPQEVKKIAQLLRSTQGNVTKALFEAIRMRSGILQAIHKLEKRKVNFDIYNLLDQSYSIGDIRTIIQCTPSAIVIDCNYYSAPLCQDQFL